MKAPTRVPQVVAPGAKFTAVVPVSARRAERKTVVVARLSIDRRAQKTDFRVGRAAVPPLKRRARRKVKVHVTVPVSLPVGSYYLLVCPGTRVKGCAATRAPITVRVAAGAPPPPATAPGALPGTDTPTATDSGTGGETGTPTPDASPTPTPTPTPTPVVTPGPPAHEPDPLKVAPVLDDARAARKTIGPDGGALVATAADGTTFTLTIPAGALQDPEDLVMKPVVSIGDLPFAGGTHAAVDIRPDGIRLLAPATLTVTPASALPADRVTPFAYRGDGEHLHLFPVSQGEAGITFQVMHFTGYGVADGTAAERAAQGARPPVAPEDQAMQDMALEQDKAAQHLRIWWDHQIYPQLMQELGLGPSERLIELVYLARTWLLQARAFPEQFGSEIQFVDVRIPQIVDEGFRRARTMCSQSDFVGARLMVQWYRIAVALQRAPGSGGAGTPFTFSDELVDHLRRCLRFEVTFDSLVHEANWSRDATVHVQVPSVIARLHSPYISPDGTDIPVWLQSDAIDPETLKWEMVDHDATSCWAFVAYQTENVRPFRVIDLNIRLDLRQLVSPDGSLVFVFPPPQEAILAIDIGEQKNWYDYQCAGFGQFHTPHLQRGWTKLNAQDVAPDSTYPSGSYRASYRLRIPFTSSHGGRLDVERTSTPKDAYDSTWSETTAITVEHRPLAEGEPIPPGG